MSVELTGVLYSPSADLFFSDSPFFSGPPFIPPFLFFKLRALKLSRRNRISAGTLTPGSGLSGRTLHLPHALPYKLLEIFHFLFTPSTPLVVPPSRFSVSRPPVCLTYSFGGPVNLFPIFSESFPFA